MVIYILSSLNSLHNFIIMHFWLLLKFDFKITEITNTVLGNVVLPSLMFINLAFFQPPHSYPT